MFLIIAWHPATGKTTLSLKLKELYPDHTLLHTDDYMEYGYKESVYKLIEDLESYNYENVIVEGIMGARLMRKLQELQFPWKVDLYIYITANLDTITDIYTRERPDKKIKDIVATCKGLDTVNQEINKTTLAHIEAHINGSNHEGMHKAILKDFQ